MTMKRPMKRPKKSLKRLKSPVKTARQTNQTFPISLKRAIRIRLTSKTDTFIFTPYNISRLPLSGALLFY